MTISEDFDVNTMLEAELAGKSVLLLEDDKIFAAELVETLQQFGVQEIHQVRLGEAAARAGTANAYDVLIFDRENFDIDGKPGLDGFAALREIRASGTGSFRSPGLILTSKRNEGTQVSHGLLGGADEYIDKRIDMIEIMTRIVTCMARSKVKNNPWEHRNGPLVVNTRELRAYFFGEPLDMGTKTFNMLGHMCQVPGKIFTKAMLYEIGTPYWKGSSLPDGFEQSLHRAINRLRTTLVPYEARLPKALTPVLMTLHNRGYVLRDLSSVAWPET